MYSLTHSPLLTAFHLKQILEIASCQIDHLKLWVLHHWNTCKKILMSCSMLQEHARMQNATSIIPRLWKEPFRLKRRFCLNYIIRLKEIEWSKLIYCIQCKSILYVFVANFFLSQISLSFVHSFLFLSSSLSIFLYVALGCYVHSVFCAFAIDLFRAALHLNQTKGKRCIL